MNSNMAKAYQYAVNDGKFARKCDRLVGPLASTLFSLASIKHCLLLICFDFLHFLALESDRYSFAQVYNSFRALPPRKV